MIAIKIFLQCFVIGSREKVFEGTIKSITWAEKVFFFCFTDINLSQYSAMCWFVPMQIKGCFGFGVVFCWVFLRILEVKVVVNER